MKDTINTKAAKQVAAQRLKDRERREKARVKAAAAREARRIKVLARDKKAAEARRLKPPTKGKGSRQPILTLAPLGDESIHPLIHLMDGKLRDTKSSLAAYMGVDPHSLYKWERACRADPHFPLPVARARQLATYFKVKPETFRPDFWSPK